LNQQGSALAFPKRDKVAVLSRCWIETKSCCRTSAHHDERCLQNWNKGMVTISGASVTCATR